MSVENQGIQILSTSKIDLVQLDLGQFPLKSRTTWMIEPLCQEEGDIISTGTH